MLPPFISILPIISSNFFSDNISRRASFLNEILIQSFVSSSLEIFSQIFHYNF